MNRIRKIENLGARVALFKGMFFGIFFVFLVFLFTILFTLGLFRIIGIALLSYNNIFYSFLLMFFSYPFALWFFGKNNAKRLIKEVDDFKTSIVFSFGVNSVIWLVFGFSQLAFGGFSNLIQLILIVLALVLVFGSLTSCTIGFYIVSLTKERIESIE
tara:strand:- start:755 stop:1228 length:474 start_codon:yes stop_codon:yes gene_type:complete